MKFARLSCVAALFLPLPALAEAPAFDGSARYEVLGFSAPSLLIGQGASRYICRLTTIRAPAAEMLEDCLPLYTEAEVAAIRAPAPAPAGHVYSDSAEDQLAALEALIAALGGMEDLAFDAYLYEFMLAVAASTGDRCDIVRSEADSPAGRDAAGVLLYAGAGIAIEPSPVARILMGSRGEARDAFAQLRAAAGSTADAGAFTARIEAAEAATSALTDRFGKRSNELMRSGQLKMEGERMLITDCQG